uniref:Uncharacterized protein n=1 Tax=Ochrobactrum phage ORM_20 TaxID=2985243 RepID=A0A9N6WTK3_9VIRU|nr:hypothetical protein ORM20_00053 [Ochrobactrum phage ORM_20]
MMTTDTLDLLGIVFLLGLFGGMVSYIVYDEIKKWFKK